MICPGYPSPPPALLYSLYCWRLEIHHRYPHAFTFYHSELRSTVHTGWFILHGGVSINKAKTALSCFTWFLLRRTTKNLGIGVLGVTPAFMHEPPMLYFDYFSSPADRRDCPEAEKHFLGGRLLVEIIMFF